MMRPIGAGAAVLAVPLALIATVVAFASDTFSCASTTVIVDPQTVPESVGRFTHTQLENAAHVVNAAATIGAPATAQTIALMVAITDYGLAQPEPAGDFYSSLLSHEDWTSLSPGAAAIAALGGADASKYDSAHTEARELLAALAPSAAVCAPGEPGEVNSFGWAAPVEAQRISAGFGPRRVICQAGVCSQAFHYATDLQAPRGTPIYAATGGLVVKAGPNGASGNTVAIDHGSRILTAYSHLYASDIYVRVGERVSAGQLIGLVGCSGVCTGDHLHFQVRVGNTYVDPVPFMRERGVELA